MPVCGGRTCGPGACEACPRSARGPGPSRWMGTRVFRANGRNRLRLLKGGSRRRLIRMVVRAGRAPTRCGVTPDAGLASPCRTGWSLPSGAGWERAGFAPQRGERDETAQGLSLVSLEGGPASRPEGAGIPHRWGAGERAKPSSVYPSGLSPVPHGPDFDRTCKCSKPPAEFSRAGFWCVPHFRHPRAPTLGSIP